MKKNHAIKNNINDLLNSLLDNTKSKTASKKIIALNEVCEDLVNQGIVPSITLVVTHLKYKAINISKQTIYNKRSGENPYRQIYDAWIDYSHTLPVKINSSPGISSGSKGIIDDSDLDSIKDPVLRHRVAILLGEVKGLRNQLNMARQVAQLPSIDLMKLPSPNSANPVIPTLTTYELEIISEFCNNKLDLDFDEHGTLKARSSIRKSTKLSSPGLKQALQKIVSQLHISN